MSNFFNRFSKNISGSVAVPFALASLVVLVGAGVAIDFVREQNVQAKLQGATDAAALAAAAKGGTLSDMKKVVAQYLATNFDERSELSDTEVNVSTVGTTLHVDVSSNLASGLMQVAGISSMPVKSVSEVKLGNGNLEIALVLDVSGSMNAGMGAGSRLDTLKTATKALVNTLTSNGSKMAAVKIGVVPFNMDVNIGTANSSIVQGAANPWFSSQAWAGCVMERPGADAYSDTYDGGTSSKGKWTAFAWPPEPNSGSNQCLNPSNGTNTGYANVQPANGFSVLLTGPNYNCVRHPIMRLSNSYASINSEIDGLTAEGNMGTILAPGIGWGLRLLSPNAPFSDGAAYTGNAKKILIVLTDGEQTTEAEYGTQNSCSTMKNTTTPYAFTPATMGAQGKALTITGPQDTFSPYGYIRDSDPFGSHPNSWSDVQTDLNNVTQAACTSVKTIGGANPIDVYTIAVSSDAGPGTNVNNLLSTCASKPENFFQATDSAGLLTAFSSIAESLKSNYLSR